MLLVNKLITDVSMQDEKFQTLTSQVWLEMVRGGAAVLFVCSRCTTVVVATAALLSSSQFWDNEFLTWEPEEFCGITNLQIPASMLWIPDVNVKEEYVLKPKCHQLI